jgi:hypothetical protein
MNLRQLCIKVSAKSQQQHVNMDLSLQKCPPRIRRKRSNSGEKKHPTYIQHLCSHTELLRHSKICWHKHGKWHGRRGNKQEQQQTPTDTELTPALRVTTIFSLTEIQKNIKIQLNNEFTLELVHYFSSLLI